jgi:glycosyltransferase involved in cell wall biosynthesis
MEKGFEAMRVLMLIDNEYGVGTFWRGYNIAKNLALHHAVEVMVVHLSRRRLDKITVKDERGITLLSVPKTGLFSIPIYSLISAFKDYDLVHVFATAKASTGVASIIAKILCHKKVVVDWDDWWTRGGLLDYPLLIGRAHILLEEVSPRLADAVIVVSDLLYRRARSLGVPSNRIFKIMNGADTSLRICPRDVALRKLGVMKNCFYIVYTGISIHSREFLMFLKAFKSLVDDYKKNAVLIMLGNVPREYMACIRKLRIEGNVVVAGYVPFNEYLLYLSIADAFVLPADPTIAERARFPIRLGDYLVAGKPILISDVGEMGNFVRQYGCGIVIKPSSPKGWLNGLITLLDDEELRLEMSARARYCAEKFSWRNIACQVYEAYKKALEGV